MSGLWSSAAASLTDVILICRLDEISTRAMVFPRFTESVWRQLTWAWAVVNDAPTGERTSPQRSFA